MSNELLKPQQPTQEIRASFDTERGFELLQRQAKALSSSSIVPTQYRAIIEKKGYDGRMDVTNNPTGQANCIVALNMANRLNADPLMVMQNLHIIEGRPSWSSTFIIASINKCGRYTPLEFELNYLGTKLVSYTESFWVGKKKEFKQSQIEIENIECIAFAFDRNNKKLVSPKISVEMAVKEGWFQKNGSKWQTMPEVMLRYRAASFFGKTYAPELLMGIQTVEETQDIIDVTPIEQEVVREEKQKRKTRSKFEDAPKAESTNTEVQNEPNATQEQPQTKAEPKAEPKADNGDWLAKMLGNAPVTAEEVRAFATKRNISDEVLKNNLASIIDEILNGGML